MSDPRDADRFEDFLQWLAQCRHEEKNLPQPSDELLAAAFAAWQDYRSVPRASAQELPGLVTSGKYMEPLEVMAAADGDKDRWMPRLRTPNGFSISALYPPSSTRGAVPAGLLVECPDDLIEALQGHKVHVSIGGRWIEVGEIDQDGKAACDLPQGMDFRPPFAIRVGEVGEQLADFEDPSERK